MTKRLTLILGGARSGKSRFAQQTASRGEKVLFVATAEAKDAEMTARIQAHRTSRPDAWDTLEAPLDLPQALAPVLTRYDTILLDCLTLWVSNLLLQHHPQDHPGGGQHHSQDHSQDHSQEHAGAEAVAVIAAETQRLVDVYRKSHNQWIVVSNEVGLGVVPTTELGRIYTDALGLVNQTVATAADDVYFMAAGLPLSLKPKLNR